MDCLEHCFILVVLVILLFQLLVTSSASALLGLESTSFVQGFSPKEGSFLSLKETGVTYIIFSVEERVQCYVWVMTQRKPWCSVAESSCKSE